MKLISFCSRIIEYSFYLIFFLVPLVFAGNTSELFEFHKMWLTFGMTTVISVAWLSKMVLQKKIEMQRTPLDIPLGLFLLSQIIATLFSLDQHVSWWGYYSRFNGGLLSTICYILLYYAFVSNLQVKHTFKVIAWSLTSGLIVALWGLPAHFGADPTCLVFRGTLDTSCWTEAFKPTIRIFSTLGQPAWLAAYLALLLPLTIVAALNNTKSQIKFGSFVALAVLFYLCLIFANTRAGFLAFVAADIVLWVCIFLKKMFPTKLFLRYLLIIHALFLLCTIFFGAPVGNIKGLSLSELNNRVASIVPQASAQTPQPSETPNEAQPTAPVVPNITDSGTIRLHVWKGAIDAWKANPIFGTGVETFAFAYYKYRPAEHNMTSEWDYLYNKAHNEYLNYLTTTGIFGLGTYVAFIGLFLWTALKKLFKKHDLPQKQQLMIVALLSGFVSILVSNFFGFSVVIINLYLFLIPVFVFLLGHMITPERTFTWSFGTQLNKHEHSHVNAYQWTAIGLLILIGGYLILSLFRYWYADVAYAIGNNYDKVGAYQEAYPELLKAVNTMNNEPVYKDEFSINLGTLATALFMQKDAANAKQFAENAIALNNQLVESHPNNVVYWKNRVRLFYTLAQGDPEQQQQYLQAALQAIQKANELAPTDAKIAYNLGVLYGQNGNYEKAIEVLTQTVKLKPDYRDAYFALGLSYHTVAVDKDEKVVKPEMQQKAIETYHYILKNLSPEDKQVKDSLRLWGASSE